MHRNLCVRCLKARHVCLCGQLEPFRSSVRFVILQHPLERKRTVGTARLAHLCIQDSHLIPGTGRDFDSNETLQRLVSDAGHHCVVLYPGPAAINISETPAQTWLPANKRCTILVIDGTWGCAKTMHRDSRLLCGLPQICFTPGRASEYGFRRQPAPHCLSTLEAIHHVLGILDPSPQADGLMHLFRQFVRHQVTYTAAETRPLSEVSL